MTYNCPKCKDTGIEIYTVDGHQFARDCSCGYLKKQMIDKQLKFASIPDTFKDMRLSTFNVGVYEDKKVAKVTVDMIKYWFSGLDSNINDGIGLYMFSAAKGSGKTRMAASIANELMYQKNIPVRFTTSIQIINEIKSSWDIKGADENRILQMLSTIKILVVDDFGAEVTKDWIGERFYHIINERYVNKLITIYTSNSSIDKLDYDERIKNRIFERSLLIPFPEESVRAAIAKKRQQEMIEAISKKE